MAETHDKKASSTNADLGKDRGSEPDDPPVDYRLIISGLSDLVCLHEPDGTYLWVSPSVRRILGYDPGDLIGRDPYELFHPEDARRIRESTHDPALEGEDNIFVRYRLRHRDGHYVWLESLTQPLFDDDGKVVHLQTSTRDISEQKKIEQALRESEGRYRAVINSLAEGIVVHGHDGQIVACNPSACRILGLTENQLLGRASTDSRWRAVDEEGRPFPGDEHPAMRTLRSGEPCRGLVMGIEKPDCETRTWITVNTQPIEGSADSAVVASFRDITDWLRAQHELTLWAKVFEASPEAILITDADSNIVALNRAFTRLTGYTTEDLVGKYSAVLRAGDHPEGFYDEVWNTLRLEGTWRGETWNRRKNGEVYPAWLSITAVRDRHGEITHYVSISTDITERHAREEHQRFLATHDPLTGLANRVLLYDRIDMELRRARRHDNAFAVLFVDLDRFKAVNDECGHRIGDLMLQEVAQRLRAQVRAADTVSRLGGDEFIVILTGVSESRDAAAIGAKMTAAIGEPYRIEDHELRVRTSIGVSLYPAHGADPEALIHAADEAMYRAKREPEYSVMLAASPV